MSTNSEKIVNEKVREIRAEFEALLTFALDSSPEEAPTAYEMEGCLFKGLLALGRRFMELYLTRQSASHRSEAVVEESGSVLPRFGEKTRSLLTLFGRIRFSRSYYWKRGEAGRFPLDAALNLPLSSVSDRVREWREALGVDQAYRPACDLLGEMIGIATSSRTVRDEIMEDAGEVEAFYESVEAPPVSSEATLLIAQADGKGVPMVRASGEEAEPKARLGKGEKTGRKKEAVVTAVFARSPRVRTPEEIVRSLFDREKVEREGEAGVEGKRLWATLDGKAASLGFAARGAAKRESASNGRIAARIALTDGSEALQKRTREALPDYEMILDFIHVDEYLWEAANALFGEKAPSRAAWVRERALRLLSGETETVISEFRTLSSEAERMATQSETLSKVAGYYERNQTFMRYDRYLALGWPIATGVIEGACRHLVKDRCERSGMRWTQEGAEALLRLRSVAKNGDWSDFHEYRREKRRREAYGWFVPLVASSSLANRSDELLFNRLTASF